MFGQQPTPISRSEHQRRQRHVTRLACQFGFAGHVEYRHILSDTGGAQFGLAPRTEQDLLTVFAEAFDRDANPQEFSLAAILAHECGHQRICRHAGLRHWLPSELPLVSEEVLASIIGAMLVTDAQDDEDLMFKAIHDLLDCGVGPTKAGRLVTDLRSNLEKLL